MKGDILEPSKWFKHYYSQKFIAKVLFDKLMTKEQIEKVRNDPSNDEYVTLFSNVHFHWGIAIENGFKGLILKSNPEQVKYLVVGDEIILKSICGRAGKTHDLLSLAVLAGLVPEEEKASKENVTCLLLSYLSDMVKWGAKYPGPFNPSTIFRIPDGISPTLIYGFHILDVISPVFEFIDGKSGETDPTIPI